MGLGGWVGALMCGYESLVENDRGRIEEPTRCENCQAKEVRPTYPPHPPTHLSWVDRGEEGGLNALL